MEPFIKDKTVMIQEARDADSGLTFMGNGIPEPVPTPPPSISLSGTRSTVT